MFHACWDGDLEKVKTIFSSFPFSSSTLNYAIQWAGSNGHLEVVKFLVSLGANVRDGNDYIFQWLCWNGGHVEVLEYIVSLGANIRANDELALHRACQYGYLEVVKYLVSLGADFKADDDCAVRLAVQFDHLQVVKFLVSIGADIRADNDCAIRWASWKENFEMVQYLLSVGAPEYLVTGKSKLFLEFCEKMKEKNRHRAAKKIYYWIIPKLYSPGSLSSYNLGLKGYQECFG